jgi:hypothetical protein
LKIITSLHANPVNGPSNDVVAQAIDAVKHLLDTWYTQNRTPEARQSKINLVEDAAALVSRVAEVHQPS